MLREASWPPPKKAHLFCQVFPLIKYHIFSVNTDISALQGAIILFPRGQFPASASHIRNWRLLIKAHFLGKQWLSAIFGSCLLSYLKPIKWKLKRQIMLSQEYWRCLVIKDLRPTFDSYVLKTFHLGVHFCRWQDRRTKNPVGSPQKWVTEHWQIQEGC